jgi:hypothetical protein
VNEGGKMKNNKNRPWFGIALILFGGVLLLHQTSMIDVKFSQILWGALAVYGFTISFQGFSKNKQGKIFWGTVLFLTSLLFILKNAYLFDPFCFGFGSGRLVLFPAWILIFGIAFLMPFINNPREYVHLVLAVVLITLGSSILLVEAGYFYEWDVWYVFSNYWPVILIALGIGMIFSRRSIKQQNIV